MVTVEIKDDVESSEHAVEWWCLRSYLCLCAWSGRTLVARTEALWGNESCPMISTETDDAGRKQNIQHQGMLGCSNITCTMNRSEASLYRFKGRMKRLIKFFLKSDCFDAWSGDELLCGNQCVYFREVKKKRHQQKNWGGRVRDVSKNALYLVRTIFIYIRKQLLLKVQLLVNWLKE